MSLKKHCLAANETPARVTVCCAYAAGVCVHAEEVLFAKDIETICIAIQPIDVAVQCLFVQGCIPLLRVHRLRLVFAAIAMLSLSFRVLIAAISSHKMSFCVVFAAITPLILFLRVPITAIATHKLSFSVVFAACTLLELSFSVLIAAITTHALSFRVVFAAIIAHTLPFRVMHDRLIGSKSWHQALSLIFCLSRRPFCLILFSGKGGKQVF